MKPKHIKKLLMSDIKNIANEPRNYCFNPDADFTRNRKIPMDIVMKGIIGMESHS